MTTLMSIRDLTVKFHTPRGLLEAVRNVSLEILDGISIGIVGESGSGKTVMSRAAMGLLSGSTVRREG
ncbi:MAG: ABC transporter ATP-binding protein, partial [Pontimonas sp.]